MLMIPVSIGELVDKITILRLKQQHLQGPARANVVRELTLLEEVYDSAAPAVPGDLWHQLQAVNQALWEVEEAIRASEAHGDFGPVFVALARQVYTLNDRRAALKRGINQLGMSDLIEEKSYAAPLRDLGDPDHRPRR